MNLYNIRVQDSYTGDFLQNACVLAFDESMQDSLGQVKRYQEQSERLSMVLSCTRRTTSFFR